MCDFGSRVADDIINSSYNIYDEDTTNIYSEKEEELIERLIKLICVCQNKNDDDQ